MTVSVDYIYFLMLLNAAFFLHLLSFVAPLPPSTLWHNSLVSLTPTRPVSTSSTDTSSAATLISDEFCPAPAPLQLFQEEEEDQAQDQGQEEEETQEAALSQEAEAED
jgi:hypothetical protein